MALTERFHKCSRKSRDFKRAVGRVSPEQRSGIFAAQAKRFKLGFRASSDPSLLR